MSGKLYLCLPYQSYSAALLLSSVQVYLSLLHMYLSPPDAHCLGPIKMELSEPQANLQAALQVLELHHNKLNTTKVRISLANTTGSCSSQVLVLTSPHEMVWEHVSILWLYSSLYFLMTCPYLFSAARILPSGILPVIVISLCTGISRQHHIQYLKGLHFPKRPLLFCSCPISLRSKKLTDAQQDMIAINH